ncbi:MAG: YceI family protein [Candidatus Zixiibacteriota bacterium]
MKTLQNMLAVLILLLVGSTSFAGDVQKFYVDDPVGRNSVTFKSEAPLEDIVGTTSKITGYIDFNPDDPMNSGMAEFSVPVKSMTTGIPVRDEHMQSAGWLNAETYPEIKIKLMSVKKADLVKEMDGTKTFDLTVAGEFTLHVITKPVEIVARATYMDDNEMTKMRLPGNILAIRTDFAINLSDYGITGPQGMNVIGAKLAEQIGIEVSLFSSTVKAEMPQKGK